MPDGYVRTGDVTFAMKATEVLGDEKLPYLQRGAAPTWIAGCLAA